MPFVNLYPFLFPALVLTLAVVAQVAGSLQSQAVARHATRVAQVEGAVERVAGDIAAKLLPVMASTPADVFTALKNAAFAEGAAYLAGALPDTIASVGATPATLATMVAGAVGKQMVAAAGAAMAVPLATAAAPAIAAAAAAPTGG